MTQTEKTVAEWVNQQRSSGLIVTRPTIQLQVLKWAEKHCELSVDFKATRGCVLGLCRDIILYFEEFDGFLSSKNLVHLLMAIKFLIFMCYVDLSISCHS